MTSPFDPACANCGHPDHEDPLNGDFCFRVTENGLCACEAWEPRYTSDESEVEDR